MRSHLTGVATALLVLAAACAPAEHSHEHADAATADGSAPDVADAGLTVQGAHAVVLPHGGAVYLTVANGGTQDDRLVRVETDVAADAETHESRMDGEMMRMEARPDGFVVPAGGTLELAPSGKHVMLVEPLSIPDGSTAIALRLHFERAGTIEIEAAIQEAGAGASHDHH